MESLYLNEMLRILFLTFQKNPKQFTSLFNNSSSIAAFDFDTEKDEFIEISNSFFSFLGVNKAISNKETLLPIQKIHPNDLLGFKEYFHLQPILRNQNIVRNSTVYKRIKCRLRHAKGYWKYFIIVSFNHTPDGNEIIHKIGFIVDEMVNPGYFKTAKGGTHFISESSQNSNNSDLHITKRENEVLEYIGKGMVAKEIADKLNISVTTVISHKKNLINKFQVKNTAELIREASRLMII